MSTIEKWRFFELPDDVDPAWLNMMPDNCITKVPGERYKHRIKGGWIWCRHLDGGNVWVTCKWCTRGEARVSRKFRQQAKEAVSDAIVTPLPKHLRSDP